jgi:hypothetical protein
MSTESSWFQAWRLGLGPHGSALGILHGRIFSADWLGDALIADVLAPFFNSQTSESVLRDSLWIQINTTWPMVVC